LALYVLASCFPHEHVGLCMPERRKAYRASHTDVVCSSLERGNGNYFGFCNYMARDRRRFISVTLFLDATHVSPFSHYVLAFEALICVIAFALVWRKRRSVLDQWLMIVALAFFSEIVINGLLISARFTLGWYVSRVFSIFTSTIVLVVLLSETTRLYGRLARSNAMLMREKKNRLMNLEALAASIAHEVRQPLTSIVMSGSALQRLIGDTPPKLDKANAAAERIVAPGHRASQILDDI